jgi:hypothetical protein
VLRETTSRGLSALVCPSRTGTREEPGTLTQGAPVFPVSSRLGPGIEPKTVTPEWLVQDPVSADMALGFRENDSGFRNLTWFSVNLCTTLYNLRYKG